MFQFRIIFVVFGSVSAVARSVAVVVRFVRFHIFLNDFLFNKFLSVNKFGRRWSIFLFLSTCPLVFHMFLLLLLFLGYY